DVAIATLLDEHRQAVSDAHYFVMRREPAYASDATLVAEGELSSDGCWQVALHTNRFLHNVSFDIKGFLPNDNYFHLSPLRPKTARLTSIATEANKLSGYAEALNLKVPVRIAVPAARAAVGRIS